MKAQSALSYIWLLIEKRKRKNIKFKNSDETKNEKANGIMNMIMFHVDMNTIFQKKKEKNDIQLKSTERLEHDRDKKQG